MQLYCTLPATWNNKITKFLKQRLSKLEMINLVFFWISCQISNRPKTQQFWKHTKVEHLFSLNLIFLNTLTEWNMWQKFIQSFCLFSQVLFAWFFFQTYSARFSNDPCPFFQHYIITKNVKENCSSWCTLCRKLTKSFELTYHYDIKPLTGKEYKTTW